MSKKVEFRLSGAGGQGLILAGIILAEAALRDNKNAVQTQSYGPEARGGASKSEVIISDDDINYPKVRESDVLLALTQAACDKYMQNLKENGILIVDENVEVKDRGNIKIYRYPILRTASEIIGNKMVSNIVALGVIQGVTNIVSTASLREAILERVPRGTEELNKKAFEEGFKLANN
ncbi:2-oxoacid:acceptor oxidoreductase family protein [Caloranaerobacter azorensis]|uniref:2-oxoglutarate ferredoxin oxidoreductase subunit gamma n=3 Tax=Caloranaerobacter azorensis TaxID=116090 RepID=A0A096DK70_9FIRM|nr:2-oxoacid:acceptor oxidoreductase family protein [Caloranaerobacter azorensis]KGG79676.1 2-oxoglutarate ferredoxin oxidoreductase subunit gamma [Caloranaerobacter azorensis H53214]QIB26048.1 2-oxoacid:ferredoxin oxidoreductase subunit gamma [Caloranaerobacter azorensis]